MFPFPVKAKDVRQAIAYDHNFEKWLELRPEVFILGITPMPLTQSGLHQGIKYHIFYTEKEPTNEVKEVNLDGQKQYVVPAEKMDRSLL